MKTKILSLVLLCLALHFLFLSCGKQQKCQGKFNRATIVEDNKFLPTNFYHPNEEVIISKFDSLVFKSEILGEVFNCVKNENNSLFINSAFAFSKSIPSVSVSERLANIEIKTLRNYNASFQTGTNMNAIISCTFDSYRFPNPVESISTIIAKSNEQLEAPLFGSAQSTFYFRLNEKPALSGDTIQLELTYTLADAKVFKDTSKKIVVSY